MANIVPHIGKRRTIAKEGVLRALVQRLTERGIIQPDEAEDMMTLLSACSDFSSNRGLGSRHGRGEDGQKRHLL